MAQSKDHAARSPVYICYMQANTCPENQHRSLTSEFISNKYIQVPTEGSQVFQLTSLVPLRRCDFVHGANISDFCFAPVFVRL